MALWLTMIKYPTSRLNLLLNQIQKNLQLLTHAENLEKGVKRKNNIPKIYISLRICSLVF